MLVPVKSLLVSLSFGQDFAFEKLQHLDRCKTFGQIFRLGRLPAFSSYFCSFFLQKEAATYRLLLEGQSLRLRGGHHSPERSHGMPQRHFVESKVRGRPERSRQSQR